MTSAAVETLGGGEGKTITLQCFRIFNSKEKEEETDHTKDGQMILSVTSSAIGIGVQDIWIV